MTRSLLPWLCLFFTACAARPATPTTAQATAPATLTTTPTAPVAPAQPPTPPTSEDAQKAELLRLSHQLLDDHDHGDAAAVAARLAPGFLQFEGGSSQTAQELVTSLRQRKPGAPFLASRSWERETVHLLPDGAVFTGKATERQGGNDVKGGYQYVGWYLLQWTRRDGGWQATLWTWQPAGTLAMREQWNEIYRNGLGFLHEPNRLLVDTVRGRKPGRALDVAMGQGRNALYLAAQGWQVTGVDISDEGLRLAREQAAQRKLPLDAVNADLDTYDFGQDRWDLVTLIYAGDKAEWLAKVGPSLRRGGLVVIEYFAKDGDKGDGFAPGQLAQVFARGFEVLRDETVEDAPDWAMDRARLVRFVARKR